MGNQKYYNDILFFRNGISLVGRTARAVLVFGHTIGVNLRKSLRLDKHLSIGMVIDTVLYLVP